MRCPCQSCSIGSRGIKHSSLQRSEPHGRDRGDMACRRRRWRLVGTREAHHSESSIWWQARDDVGLLLQRVVIVLGEVGGHALFGRLLQHHRLQSIVQGNVQEVRHQPDALALVLQALALEQLPHSAMHGLY